MTYSFSTKELYELHKSSFLNELEHTLCELKRSDVGLEQTPRFGGSGAIDRGVCIRCAPRGDLRIADLAHGLALDYTALCGRYV